MNEIVKFLLRDKFMPEMHLDSAGFTYVCGTFIKNKQYKSLMKGGMQELFIKMN